MRIIIFGGDGFCGWPTALHLSANNHEVLVVDNFARRKIDLELGSESLTPILSMEKRLEAWKEITGKEIKFEFLDIAEHYHRLLCIIKEYKPDAVVHFAEQRAAPYSMRSPFHKRYTINNNINATHNILCAIVESRMPIKLVHLGSTGYYGYMSVPLSIPEGYLTVKLLTDTGEEVPTEIPYPPKPGSIYHTTKTMDALMFQYYNKNDGIDITDLHQGIVWGTQTKETKLDERLINRFDWEGDFGTVLNRFLMQSQVGHPLTVHGTGGQTRAFIHIQNTVECIRLAVEDTTKENRVKIYNQTTECHNVLALAKKIQKMTGAEIRFYKNPRDEDPENKLKFINDGLLGLGLSPITLDEGLLEEVIEIANKYKDRCDPSKIICTSLWNRNLEIDLKGKSNGD